jgi:hypothetical protein
MQLSFVSFCLSKKIQTAISRDSLFLVLAFSGMGGRSTKSAACQEAFGRAIKASNNFAVKQSEIHKPILSGPAMVYE